MHPGGLGELQSGGDELGALVFSKQPHAAAGRREYPGTGPDDIGTADSGGADAVGGADDDLVQRLGNLPDADGCCTAVKQAFQHTQRQPPGAAHHSQGIQQLHQFLPDPVLLLDHPQTLLLRFGSPAEGFDVLRCPDALQQLANRRGKARAICLPQALPELLQRTDHPAAHPVDTLQPGGILRGKVGLEAIRMVFKGHFCQSRRPTFHT